MNDMQRSLLFFLAISLIVLTACDQPIPPGPTLIDPPYDPPYDPPAASFYPDISTRVSPSNPSLGESFTLSVSVEAEEGINELEWESGALFGGDGAFFCDLQLSCSHDWEIEPQTEGDFTYYVWATNADGAASNRIGMQVSVGPSSGPQETDHVPIDDPQSDAECGNYDCEVWDGETYENCPDDCIPLPFTCSNELCEIGESEFNCPQDCDTMDIDCGNDDCEVGESNENCPDDCGLLEPDCGNGICESWEGETTCYKDCWDQVDDLTVPMADRCSSNSDCGYKQKCKSGLCVTVDCTTDSHCSGCRRCSGNSCVSCGSGPYGCYC